MGGTELGDVTWDIGPEVELWLWSAEEAAEEGGGLDLAEPEPMSTVGGIVN